MAMYKCCPKCDRPIEYTKKYCDICSAKLKQHKKDTDIYYNKYIRDKESSKFYESKEWKRVRDIIMNKYNHLCIYSLLIEHKIVKADVAHHIKELKTYRELGLSKDNLIPLCHAVHNKLHKDYNEEKENMLLDLLSQWEKLYE